MFNIKQKWKIKLTFWLISVLIDTESKMGQIKSDFTQKGTNLIENILKIQWKLVDFHWNQALKLIDYAI